MKSLLLKIAYWINKHYRTIEIESLDLIKCNNQYYSITKLNCKSEIGCCDVLEIIALGIEHNNIQ